MQNPSLNKLEIISPNCAKSISFNFGSGQNKPLQLISWHDNQGFVVNPEAHKFFDSLRDNNLGIITIVGRNRTGKSYLLNRVVLNQNSGFSVGHTVNPCTKGIWAWPHVIEIENKNNESEKLNVVVLDTEGTDATDQHENYDTKVFMLGMLLSSYFVYNSVGAIDEKAIQNLSLIINLSKHLQKTNEKEFEDLMECFPSFLWVVRDFSLKLVDLQGNPITQKEYLENALKPQKGLSEAIEAKNRIRRLLSNFFKDRDCFTMPIPADTVEEMQRLHELKPENLRPEFNEQVNLLRRKIWMKVKPKMFRGKPINGPAFLVLCKLLCNMLNSGETLSLENSWNSICRIECEKIVREISEEYDHQMKLELDKGIVNESGMASLHKKKKNEALESLKKRAMGDQVKDFEDMLNETLKERFKSLKKIYYSKIESRMKESVEEKLEDFEKKIQNKEFTSFVDLVLDFKKIKVDLEEEYRTPEAHEALLEYLFQSFFRATENFYDDIDSTRKQSERLRQVDLENFESKIAYIEKQHQAKMQESSENFRNLESEKMQLRDQIASLEEKVRRLEKEKSNEGAKIDEKVVELSKEHKIREENFMAQLRDLNSQLEQLKKEKAELVAENDNRLARQLEEVKKEKHELSLESERRNRDQEHQVEQKEEQIQSLNNTISELKKELKHERHSHKASVHAMEEIKKMMTVSPMSSGKRRESTEDGEERRGCRCRILDEVLKENKDLKRNIDILNGRMESNVNEFYLQRNDLENKLNEIERHYREKQLQDEFAISTLKKRVKTYENADLAMAETNKNLSITLERSDTRCFNLEKKVVKLKKYHKIFKNAEEMSCRFCTKLVKKTLFMAHFEICGLNEDRNYDECSLYPVNPSLSITLDKHHLTHPPSNRSFKIEGQLGRQRCSVTKSFQDVHRFIHSIKDQLKHSEILPYLEELLRVNEERLSEENWTKTKELLNDVLSSLVKMPQVRDSSAFHEFLPFRTTDQLTSAFISRHSQSPEDLSFPSSRARETKIIFDNQEANKKGGGHSRKESHRYFDERDSYIHHVLGEKGKTMMTRSPDIGSHSMGHYENADS